MTTASYFLYRNTRGDVIHQAGCRHGKHHWLWADQFETPLDLLDAMPPWLRFGRCCDARFGEPVGEEKR